MYICSLEQVDINNANIRVYTRFPGLYPKIAGLMVKVTKVMLCCMQSFCRLIFASKNAKKCCVVLVYKGVTTCSYIWVTKCDSYSSSRLYSLLASKSE